MDRFSNEYPPRRGASPYPPSASSNERCFVRRVKIAVRFLTYAAVMLVCISVSGLSSFGQDPGWPRQKVGPGGDIVYYQPQVDDWKDHKQLDFRIAFSLTPSDGHGVVGVAVIRAQTD